MCAIDGDTVLLAYGPAGLCEYSLRSDKLLSERAPASIRHVYRVAFVSATGTLLLLVQQPKVANSDEYWELVTMQHEESQWVVVQSYNPRIPSGSDADPNIAVCGSLAVYSQFRDKNTARWFTTAAHTLENDGVSKTFESAIKGLACTLSDGKPYTHVEFFALESGLIISYKLKENHKVGVSVWTVDNIYTHRLFSYDGHDDRLLFPRWNSTTKMHDIVLLQREYDFGKLLIHQIPLKWPTNQRFLLRAWTLANRKLVIVGIIDSNDQKLTLVLQISLDELLSYRDW